MRYKFCDTELYMYICKVDLVTIEQWKFELWKNLALII